MNLTLAGLGMADLSKVRAAPPTGAHTLWDAWFEMVGLVDGDSGAGAGAGADASPAQFRFHKLTRAEVWTVEYRYYGNGAMGVDSGQSEMLAFSSSSSSSTVAPEFTPEDDAVASRAAHVQDILRKGEPV
jgi:hypothetical protein